MALHVHPCCMMAVASAAVLISTAARLYHGLSCHPAECGLHCIYLRCKEPAEAFEGPPLALLSCWMKPLQLWAAWEKGRASIHNLSMRPHYGMQ